MLLDAQLALADETGLPVVILTAFAAGWAAGLAPSAAYTGNDSPWSGTIDLSRQQP